MAPNSHMVISALVASCANSESSLTVLKQIRKKGIRIQRAILRVLKKRWKVMLQASLFSICLLSTQDYIHASRSCQRLSRNGGCWHLVWTSYSDKRFTPPFRVSRGPFQYILYQIRADIKKQVMTEEPLSPDVSWLSVCID